MSIASFDTDRLYEPYREDHGAAFQRLVADSLRPRFGTLHAFTAEGVDGGIDLICEDEAGRIVIECKKIGRDGLERAQRSWRTVRDRLGRNLEPTGKPRRSQYAPWYATASPVHTYLYCISSRLQNEGQRAALKSEILADFHQLAERPHLAHLGGIDVQVLDWADFDAALTDRPHLAFRYFPDLFPAGFKSPSTGKSTGFQAYLTSDKLPYYSREEHLRVHPAVGFVLDNEAALLERLGTRDTDGLIISGPGGVGKTRLMVELGGRAQNMDWVVGNITAGFDVAALDALARRLRPETPALLLIDYLELADHFGALVDRIREFNEVQRLRIHYVATCRSSFYNVLRDVAAHAHVDLALEGAASDWYASYRKRAVSHILSRSGVDLSAALLERCEALPFLAVFVAYLSHRGKDEDPSSMLSEEDFGRWMRRRVQQTFETDADFEVELATLAASFPLARVHALRIPDARARLLDKLIQDGWVEERDEGERVVFAAVHDVLADRLLYAHLEDLPAAYSRERFVRNLFEEAASYDGVASPFTAFQRLADVTFVHDVPWKRVVIDQSKRHPEAWRAIRSDLLASPLFDDIAALALLQEIPTFWDGAEADSGFGLSIGWIAKQVVTGTIEPDATSTETLADWVERCAPYATSTNYVLTQGLRLVPQRIAPYALAWIRDYPLAFQTHYLLVAWLREPSLDSTEIAEATYAWLDHSVTTFQASFVLAQIVSWEYAGHYVTEWLHEHATRPEARFVFITWLYANGPFDEVADGVRRWLDHNSAIPEAQSVLAAWLKAGGASGEVADAVRSWLSMYGTTDEADYVLTAWLSAGGAADEVADDVRTWLSSHRDTAEARFVLAAWLDSGGAADEIADDVRTWLSSHRDTEEASHVLAAWLKAGGASGEVADAVRSWLSMYGTTDEASHVLAAWLKADGAHDQIADDVRTWLSSHRDTEEASHVLAAWLSAGGAADEVADDVRTWLSMHGTTDEAQFVLAAWLKAGGALEKVADDVRTWLSSHRDTAEARFVLAAWLDSGGAADEVADDVRTWLSSHRDTEEASHVLAAWLDSGGAADEVADDVRTWLSSHRDTEEASHVLAAWLKADGAHDQIADDVRTWLSRYGTTFAASFVFVGWLNSRAPHDHIWEQFERWLPLHLENSLLRISLVAWLQSDGDMHAVREIVERFMNRHPSNASGVLQAWRDRKGPLLEIDRDRKNAFRTLEPGLIVEGTVKAIVSFGAFVILDGGVEGLVHLNELAWRRLYHPSDVVSVDETLTLRVLEVDNERDKVWLGRKHLLPKPWDEFGDTLNEGDTVEGKIVSITDYGAFAEVCPGIEGLIHISEMSWTEHVRHPSQCVTLDDTIVVYIVHVDREKQRLSLSLKRL